MGALTTALISRPPSPLTRQTSDIVRRLSSRLEEVPGAMRPAVNASLAPSAAETRALQARASEIADSLSRGNEREIGAEYARLRSVFAAGPTDSMTAFGVVEAAASALAEFPLWTVTEACRRVLKG